MNFNTTATPIVCKTRLTEPSNGSKRTDSLFQNLSGHFEKFPVRVRGGISIDRYSATFILVRVLRA